MKLKELVGALYPAIVQSDDAAPARPDLDIEITGITADSRKVEPGFLFAALPGVQADGAKFISAALEKGASAVLLPTGSTASAGLNVPVVADNDPRRALAILAAAFYKTQPETIIAVTGTNGKTSVASFVRQLWAGLGVEAASLGTVGVFAKGSQRPLSHTTPEPVEMHNLLSGLAQEGVTHLALEASSHGLQQRRLDGIRFTAGAFTNISRDHLDYHPTFEDYFLQKLRLFKELLPDAAPVVIDIDAPGGPDVHSVANNHGLHAFTVGRRGHGLHLMDLTRDGYAQRLRVRHEGKNYDLSLPLVGDFQAQNALVAAGLCIVTGHRAEKVLPLLETLEGARGRLELAGTTKAGAPVFVDYAHTPDALENALRALRPYADRELKVVFGCGGDRDQGKRPLMGEKAVAGADLVYVTDDNPRGEDPEAIRAQIMTAANGAKNIAGREQAIREAVAHLKIGDVLLVAGKGHETGQIIGNEVIAFSDHEAVRAAITGEVAQYD